MILTVDVGNSEIALGGFVDETLLFVARIATTPHQTEDEYSMKIEGILRLHGVERGRIEGAILSSVVPQLNRTLKNALRKLFQVEPLLVGPGIKTGLAIQCDAPSSVGADLICACVAVHDLYGSPGLIVDIGTATKMMVLNDNGAFIGASIIPGVLMGLDALAANTAQLPNIDLGAPSRIIAKNTPDCMRSGVIFGHACMLDGMIARINEEMEKPLSVYATGGLASIILPHCRTAMIRDEFLVLRGLSLIYQKNK